jgi:hypothetical protein
MRSSRSRVTAILLGLKICCAGGFAIAGEPPTGQLYAGWATVDHAVFRVPNLAVTGLEEDLVLIVVPVAAEWNPATVGWMSPWSENGGEYAWNRAMVYPVRPGFSGTLEGEIFNVVEEWWTGELGNYGLMLMKADPAEYSLGAEVSTLGTALGSAMIEVHYSRIE